MNNTIASILAELNSDLGRPKYTIECIGCQANITRDVYIAGVFTICSKCINDDATRSIIKNSIVKCTRYYFYTVYGTIKISPGQAVDERYWLGVDHNDPPAPLVRLGPEMNGIVHLANPIRINHHAPAITCIYDDVKIAPAEVAQHVLTALGHQLTPGRASAWINMAFANCFGRTMRAVRLWCFFTEPQKTELGHVAFIVNLATGEIGICWWCGDYVPAHTNASAAYIIETYIVFNTPMEYFLARKQWDQGEIDPYFTRPGRPALAIYCHHFESWLLRNCDFI